MSIIYISIPRWLEKYSTAMCYSFPRHTICLHPKTSLYCSLIVWWSMEAWRFDKNNFPIKVGKEFERERTVTPLVVTQAVLALRLCDWYKTQFSRHLKVCFLKIGGNQIIVIFFFLNSSSSLGSWLVGLRAEWGRTLTGGVATPGPRLLLSTIRAPSFISHFVALFGIAGYCVLLRGIVWYCVVHEVSSSQPFELHLDTTESSRDWLSS